MEPVCPTKSEDEPGCESARWALCGLAVGQTLGRGGAEVARHVEGCPACDGFVDDLAEIRRSLGVDGPPTNASALAPGRLHERAQAALTRELEARLARDLLAQTSGEGLRPLGNRHRDVHRLQALRPVSRLPADTWAEVRQAVLKDDTVHRGQNLRLASELDGSGLDVALAWLSFLVRSGQDDRAHVVTERLLAEVD